MKKRLILLTVLMLTVCMMTSCKNTESSAETENEETDDEDRDDDDDEEDDAVKRKPKLGKLIGFQFSPGYSDMEGGYHNESLEKNEDGEWVIVSRDRETHSEPETVTVYAVSEEALKDFEAFIIDNNIVKLERRKDSDLFMTDYSPWRYSITFDDSSVGGDGYKIYNIEEYTNYSNRDYDLIKKMSEKFKDLHGEVISQTTEGDDMTSVRDRMTCYEEILYKYKEAQDGGYSEDQVIDLGLQTELIQHGWPFAVSGDSVGYLYYDIDSDGEDELIITYYGDPIDIYGYDGEEAVLAYSTPYRGITELYPGGLIRMILSYNASDYSTTLYRFDPDLGYCLTISEEEFDDAVSGLDPVILPEGEPLSRVTMPNDYEYGSSLYE